MDSEQLKLELNKFKELAAQRGRPLSDMCIEEAFPGDDSSSFILKVVAPWVDNMDCSEALDFLIDVLWDSVDTETRSRIFAINVHDSRDQLHCLTEVD